ncbi:MAG TPA: hypothetical protein VGG11_12630 [Xanthobacteraceae bacterium]|jgi:hypothetical protein
MAMQNAASDTVVKNLVEALNRLQADLDRVELWTTALISFQQAPPDYRPDGDYALPRRDDSVPH